MELAAAFASGVPFIGPALGVLLKRVGDGKVGIDLKEMLMETVWEIQAILPEINDLKTLRERIKLLEDRKDDPKLSNLMHRAAKELKQFSYDMVKFETINSSLSARNMRITGRPVSSSASRGSTVDFTGMRHTNAH